MIGFIDKKEDDRKSAWAIQFIEDLVAILEKNLGDDRYAIPAMEISGFLLDSCFPLVAVGSETRFVFTPLLTYKLCSNISYSLRKLFVLVQKAHYKSSNIPRLEAAIRVYSALSRVPSTRMDALKKLTSMLLHPYPKVCFNDYKQ